MYTIAGAYERHEVARRSDQLYHVPSVVEFLRYPKLLICDRI